MGKNDSAVDDLENADVFKELTREQFTECINAGKRIKVSAKTVLFHQGDRAEKCYWVQKGRLKLSRVNENGKEVTIRYIRQGELTAAIAVIKKSEYPVTARAIEYTEVVGWDQEIFTELMKQFPFISVNMLTVVLNRLDDLQKRYSELCTEHVEKRIARTLLRFVETSGSKRSDGICIDFRLSRQDLAEYIGTTLYTVSRTLSDWEKKGWIKSEQKKLILTRPHAIANKGFCQE